MRVSKFVKPNKDILIEYIYDDGNNISESYKILKNIRNNSFSYIAASASITNNTPSNQLVQLDAVTNNFGLLNTETYSFLQTKDYASGFPIRHDTIKVHIPINYTFGEYLGFYLKVYSFDYINKNQISLSNFYFDGSNVDQSYLQNYNSPPFLFQEKLWGKNITLQFPSVYSVSRLRVGTGAKQNSINDVLTSGLGLSLTSPVFFDFHFINQKKTVNSITTFNLAAKISMSVPQAPDFENIGLRIDHALNGDYFEIYGTFNGDINQFDNFIQDSVLSGSRYYVTYTITLFEQNIRGKSFAITVTDNFNEKIEYRPIIKFSTTTAIIDVEMNIIDAVDQSSIYRKSSYGMLQDEVAKYSINLTKINIANASKPKIYNIKSPEGVGIFGSNGLGAGLPINQVYLDPIKVNYAVLTNIFSIVAKSDNVVVGKNTFYGIGKLEIILQPFDNVVQFKLAQDVTQVTTAPSLRVPDQISASVKYMDLTGMGEIKLVIKNNQVYFETTLYFGSNEVDLANGIVVFKIPQSKIPDIRKVYDSGFNLFYITSSTETGTVTIYSGLFLIFDTLSNINTLRVRATEAQQSSQSPTTRIIPDPDITGRQGTAIVTLQQVAAGTGTNNQTGTSSTANTSTSVESTIKIKNVTYTIDSKSNLIINGYTWTSSQLKEVLGLPSPPIQLSFKTDSLYSFNKYLDKLSDLSNKLKSKYVKNPADKSLLDSTQNTFTNNNNQTQ
jgi:hypothetical protein